MAVEADIAVVVDVLSFTTTLTVAVERGMTVFPYVWKGSRAEEYAAERDAVLAIGRFEDRGEGGVTLSPAAMSRVEGVERIVLPSPNGSSICFGLADSGLTVVGACLRNRAAVARWLAPQLSAVAKVAVVAAGERWPDGSLRPAHRRPLGRRCRAGARSSLPDPASARRLGSRSTSSRPCSTGFEELLRLRQRGGAGRGRFPRRRTDGRGARRQCRRTGADW